LRLNFVNLRFTVRTYLLSLYPQPKSGCVLSRKGRLKVKNKNKMQENKQFSSSSLDADVTFLGTPETLSGYSPWQESQIGAVAQCYYSGVSETCVEFKSTYNPRSGCEYSRIDSFWNTTLFEREKVFGDLGVYAVTTSAVECFSQTFSGSSLYGNQLAVAYAAFSLSLLGRKFSIVVSSTETGLINFCKDRNWTYYVS